MKSFIPVSEGIEPEDNSSGQDHGEKPIIPFPFNRAYELPNAIETIGTICNLKLKQGCYKISMDPLSTWSFTPHTAFMGTMRVEAGADKTTVSGDLYKYKHTHRPLKYPAVPEIPKFREFAIPSAFADTRPIIPIFPRKSYHSYLKVTGIKKDSFVRKNNPCTITLTVEEYNYTHPGDEDQGSFPEVPTRILRIVLQKAPTSPAGFSGPNFTGTVYEGTTRLPYTFSMLWVSDFYRRASVELENVAGVNIPAAVGANDFRSIYATAGWDLTVINGDANLAVPAGVAANDPWSDAELHAFMLANRNPATNLDKEWRVYHVSVPFSSQHGGIFGIMFDELGDPREGATNFMQNLRNEHNNNGPRLRSAAHEIGHCFNQLHPATEHLADDNSIMSQSGATQTAIENNGGVYPRDINFAFNEHNRQHMIHLPDVVVRPGGEDFQFGHDAGFSPQAEDNADEAGLQLSIEMESDSLKLGEALVFRTTLANKGAYPVKAPHNISTKFHCTEITVSKTGGKTRHFRSFVIACDSDLQKELSPGKSMVAQETIFWDKNGCIFNDPGSYKVSVSVSWMSDEAVEYATSAEGYVWINYPLTEQENRIASLLLNDEVGKYIALGGNAHHLKEAVRKIQAAQKTAKDHPALQRISKIDARKLLTKPRDKKG